MGDYSWQVPLAVMAGIIVIESAANWALSTWPNVRIPPWTKKVALLILAAVATVVAISAWGDTQVEAFISVFTGIATVLTFLAYRSPVDAGEVQQKSTGKVEPSDVVGSGTGHTRD